MKWAKDMNGCFAQGDIEMANEKSISKSHFTISIILQKKKLSNFSTYFRIYITFHVSNTTKHENSN